MPTRRTVVALAAALLALAGLVPAAALAADAPDVTGTVTLDGAPVAGAAVQVVVEDMVFPATTAADGTWAVTAGIATGQTLTVSAVSPSAASSPDEHGCVTYTAHAGRVQVAVDALPLAPIAVPLDTPVTSTVCSATASPRHGPTPPPTDASAPSSPGAGLGMPLVVVGLLAAAVAVAGPGSRRRVSRR